MAPVMLLLGSGANIGSSVAEYFLSQGYSVGTVSRSTKDKAKNLNANLATFSADLSDPGSVASIFEQVKLSLGLPEVVVYNAARASTTEKNDPLALSVEEVTRDLAVNTVSAFAAAQESIKTFRQLSHPASRTFIYTGNVLNTTVMAGLGSLGMGKSASAHFIQSAAEAYANDGFKFYYCDERKPDGSPAFMDIDGAAHAKFYFELSKTQSQQSWQQTFVKDQGFKEF